MCTETSCLEDGLNKYYCHFTSGENKLKISLLTSDEVPVFSAGLTSFSVVRCEGTLETL